MRANRRAHRRVCAKRRRRSCARRTPTATTIVIVFLPRQLTSDRSLCARAKQRKCASRSLPSRELPPFRNKASEPRSFEKHASGVLRAARDENMQNIEEKWPQAVLFFLVLITKKSTGRRETKETTSVCVSRRSSNRRHAGSLPIDPMQTSEKI